MSAYETLAALARAPYQQTDERPMVAVFPMWFPYELVVAAGLRASEWWGFELPTHTADKHYPPFVCTLVKSNFEVMLDGGRVPAGMVFPSATCDSIQNSAGLFRRHFPDRFSAYFRMTQNPESAGSAAFLRGEIERVLDGLRAFTGKAVGEDDLRAAIAEVNRMRAAVRALLAKTATGPATVPARAVYTAIRGAAADIGARSAALLREFTAEIAPREANGPKLMLVGMTADPLDALDVMERAGATIVGDDLGLGWRTFAVDAPETGDPVDALVTRLLNSPPCSSLHFTNKRRADAVTARAKELGADAVVFTRLKFCDPEAFDYPHVKGALDAAGLPSLLLERELTSNAEGAVATRIEAFVEQIG